jgi:hypothetical protein
MFLMIVCNTIAEVLGLCPSVSILKVEDIFSENGPLAIDLPLTKYRNPLFPKYVVVFLNARHGQSPKTQ